LPAIAQLIGAITIAAVVVRQLIGLSQPRTLIHQDENLIWIERSASGSETRGTLIPAGYRSAGMLVMVLQQSNERYHRVVVWRDSVTPQQFSYLHHQLAFATSPARRRSLSAFLSLR